MSTSVTITLIICGTVILLSLISMAGTAITAKKANDTFKNIFNDEEDK